MKNLQNLLEDLNFELKHNTMSEVDEILDYNQYDLLTLVMSTHWVDKETLDVISNYTGDPNPGVYKHLNEDGSIDSRLEIVVEWVMDDELPF